MTNSDCLILLQLITNSNYSFQIGSLIQSTSQPPSLLACPVKDWLEDGLHSHGARSSRLRGDHSGRTYLALRVDAYILSSWIRLLSNLLVQIRRFDYRNDPVRVQSQRTKGKSAQYIVQTTLIINGTIKFLRLLQSIQQRVLYQLHFT
ncbi:hypothetical protein FGO68_gene4401 [Halteria grandinella]|uniref:Uncharacterized protein n=1 Tax=Halteria grandinella TaxID=5974 RepID=A0A8J8T6K0_HALGN|nr:hypothetical protein FGO68_gene4401 [Halteria grandinella]